MMTWIALASLILAAVPAVVLLVNLRLYRPAKAQRYGRRPRVSVLIPARNEQHNIRTAVASALANKGVDVEVLVLDDQSEDDTAAIVRALARRDPRVTLLRGSPLPPGANGKQHACHQLARHAIHPHLVFMDADVRLTNRALASLVGFLDRSGASLASGIPLQRTGSLGERLIVPLIHFVLLGFLPMWRMRRSRHPAYAAGVGQLFVARREDYWRAGGHEAILSSRHDGLDLPRVFREAGLHTDLFDATELAECRMYPSSAETWQGFLKNADEGLGRPALIVPMTALLLGGQVGPWLLLLAAPWLPGAAIALAAAAALLTLTVRRVAARRFHQQTRDVWLHPLGIFALVAIQWQALGRRLLRKPAEWKGRSYGSEPAAVFPPVSLQSPSRTS